MARSVDQYLKMIHKLLPRGKAWSRSFGSMLDGFSYALARELVRVEQRLDVLIEESDPRSANETLDWWESFLGLPDDCTGVAPTVEERRRQIIERYASRGGISRQFYIDLAATLGADITITEFTPFAAEVSGAEDPLSGGDWDFTWQVNSSELNAVYFAAETGSAEDLLIDYSNDLLECVMDKKNRASRILIFAYT